MNQQPLTAIALSMLLTILTACGSSDSSDNSTNENSVNETVNTPDDNNTNNKPAEPNTPTTPEPKPEPEPKLYTGIFTDSAVQGIQYQTSSQTGLTNSFGEFSYQLNETVSFSIGGITFPTTKSAAQITPLTLFATSSTTDTGVVNMARLL
jgi:hypothetical protein